VDCGPLFSEARDRLTTRLATNRILDWHVRLLKRHTSRAFRQSEQRKSLDFQSKTRRREKATVWKTRGGVRFRRRHARHHFRRTVSRLHSRVGRRRRVYLVGPRF